MPLSVLDEHTGAHVAELFRAFSDTSRVRIMSALLDGEKNVSRLAELVGISDSAASHHMRGLRQTRIVTSAAMARKSITASLILTLLPSSNRVWSTFGVINRLFIVLVVSICIFSLSLHFIVEGLGGVHDHFIGQQAPGMMHSHDGDLFILSKSGPGNTAQAISHAPVPSNLNQISRPLPPLFHPPKSS